MDENKPLAGAVQKISDLLMSSIWRKISANTAVIIILVSGMVLVGYYQLAKARAFSEQVIPHSLRMDRLQDFALSISSLDANIERFLIIGGEQFQEAISHDLDHMSNAIRSMKAEADGQPPQTLSDLESVVANLERDVLLFDTAYATWSSRDKNEHMIAIYAQIAKAQQLHRSLTAETLDQLQDLTLQQEKSISLMIQEFLALGALAFLCIILISVHLSRSISRPLVRLHNATQEVSRGRLDTQIPMASNDEIGRLAASFNEMVTSIKEAQAALQASEERYRTIFETASVSIWEQDFSTVKAAIEALKTKGIQDFQGYLAEHPEFVSEAAEMIKVIDVNQAALKMFRATNKAQLLGSLERVLTEETLDLVQEQILAIARGRSHFQGEAVKQTLHGERLNILMSMTIPTEPQDFARILVSIMDITARKRAEKERAELQVQLFQVQKMEAIGILAGGVAHDFNNLLTAIRGYTDLVLHHLEPDDPLSENVKQIGLAGERASSLTRQLLAFSRRQVLQSQAVDLNDLVANMGKMLQRLIGENINLVTFVEPELAPIEADPGQMEQVIMNLVVNACDAMPDGGELTIETENVDVAPEFCQVYPEARPGRFVCLSVRDTGGGIEDRILARIFEPFVTTKETGTGLGLSVVYGIVKQHQGWINVHSKLGQGAVFRVYLPVSTGKRPLERAAPPPEEQYEGHGKRILIVEDEPLVRELTCRALREHGYAVFDVANAAEARQVFDQEEGDFALVFSDIGLPGECGLTLAEELCNHKPELSILLSSGHADTKAQWSIIRRRKYPFLHKPYNLHDLLKAIHKALAQDR